MLYFSTKTDLERENEEAERLVRKSPKVKPPRYDKRRECLETDEDSDLDSSDVDLSENYKVIGGSEKFNSSRIVERFKEGKEKLIVVRLKKTPKKVVRVTKKTLQKSPNLYDEVTDKEELSRLNRQLDKEDKSKKPAGPQKEEKEEKHEKKRKEVPEGKSKKQKSKSEFVDTSADVITPDPQDSPGAPTRSYTKGELRAAHRRLMRVFAAPLLLALNPPLHPDEIDAMISEYGALKSLPSDKLKSLQSTLTNFYTLNPNDVPPPKRLENEKGDLVPFDEFPEEKREKALRRHQIQTVVMGLAAKKLVSDKFVDDTGAPKELADSIADWKLKGNGKDLSVRDKEISAEAKKLFQKGLENPDLKLSSDEVVKNVLKKLDPISKKLAVGYFQAQDYQHIRKQFLGRDTETAISEHQGPRAIVYRLNRGINLLRGRQHRYPEGTAQDTGTLFKDRVLRNLKALDPDKAAEVSELLSKRENDYYEKSKKSYEKALKRYQKELKKAQAAFEKAMATYYEKVESGKKPKQPSPPKSRLLSKGIFEPQSPKKPEQYKDNSEKPEASASRVLEKFREKQKTRGRKPKTGSVVAQYLSNSFNTYTFTTDMKRESVYWGVKPKKVEYSDWSQVQARDLEEKDVNKILASAREWLKSPVLSENIDGIVKDTQVRAALDLALRADGYDHAIHPTVYNNLLSRLGKKSQDETLLTIRTARDLEMSNKVTLNTGTVDQLLASMDRMAATLQEKHEAWGMHFEAAKAYVNEIDRCADELERAAYGERSMIIRQAQVIQKDADEGYMDTFQNPMKPIQTDADEPYMAAYKDDQSSAVENGKSSTGRPLAP